MTDDEIVRMRASLPATPRRKFKAVIDPNWGADAGGAPALSDLRASREAQRET